MTRAAPRPRTARAPIRVGRRFLAAFLTYERRPDDPLARSELATAAENHLATILLTAPPRQVPGMHPSQGTLVSLRGADDATGSVMPLVATVRRGARTTQLVIVVERKDARWLVARFGG